MRMILTNKISVRRLTRAEVGFIVRGRTQGDLHLIAPWCNRPVAVTLATAKGSIPDVSRRSDSFTQFRYRRELNIAAACRRCAGCLDHKRKLWGARAYGETIRAHRTWFGTLTFTPNLHDQALRIAMSRTWEDGVDYCKLTEAQQLAVNAEVLYAPIQRFVKRLRKQGSAFRYLIVPEPHKSGLVHFHVLFHETDPDKPLRKAQLEEQWRAGISHWRVVQTGKKSAVWYVCKYLSKEAEYKPRASTQYGTTISGTVPLHSRERMKLNMLKLAHGTDPLKEDDNLDTNNEETLVGPSKSTTDV